ncbi:hypothetical protein BHF71_10545 [Vulcanibacillus modesticaldus]|uniref:Uncharacterized protein n=1 Tax=Vulcanibacillus modesticaldus TaxID=337097 RepID=A0A1D2YTD7_9BACI|nr:hypothetical protein [Vulcanibacillus modesticaldus]OEF98957.1 hypothetical protein BHF71_10545 [Vulcanibacillus modesticaldus]
MHKKPKIVAVLTSFFLGAIWGFYEELRYGKITQFTIRIFFMALFTYLVAEIVFRKKNKKNKS